MIHVIALAVLPALILLYYTYQQDKLQREPVKNIVKAFFFGWGSVFASLLISMPSMRLGLFPQEIHSLSDAFRTAFFGAAIPEETAKLFMLWLFLRKCRAWTVLCTPYVWAWALPPSRTLSICLRPDRPG